MPGVRDLWNAFSGADRILMDIPMGLPFSDGGRQCDMLARSFLGPGRGASIFPVPARDAVYAPDYRTACAVNREICGKMISRQSWNICPKIRDVDRFLRKTPEAAGRVFESHPELCFYALSGNRPMVHGKRCREGIDERLDLLSSRFRASRKVYETAVSKYRRKDVSRDDIVDAMGLAVTAYCYRERLRSLPGEPPLDRMGIPMAILMPGGD